MSDQRDEARDLLRELLSELLRNGNGNGTGTAPVPQVPPPPVAAVHRPSTWNPEEISEGAAEHVSITNDDELNAFARALTNRLEHDPSARQAIKTGRLTFTLGAGTATGPTATRIKKGAVTERTIRDAAANGRKLILAPGAVLTPLARDLARKLRVHIEKEQT